MNIETHSSRELTNRKSKEELSLGYGDYLRFSKLLLDRAGLYFSENRRSELEYRLRMAFASSTCADLDEFYNLLQDEKNGAVEMDILINSVTVSESHFFRDAAQFKALSENVFPHLIERKRSSRTLRIWSAGCANGEEPYSIAMLLRDLIPDIDNWSITILATDINTTCLGRARTGVYNNWSFREERAIQLRPRYFRQVDSRYELTQEVRRMVLFNHLNLVEPCYPSFETNTLNMDLILCRNVTIYFSELVTRWVVDRFYDSLVEGGWLVVGHSEPSMNIYRRFRVRNFKDAILYQRMPETSSLRMPVLTPIRQSPPLPALGPDVNPAPTPTTKPLLPAYHDLPASTPVHGARKENSFAYAKELLEYGRVNDALSLLQKVVQDEPVNPAALVLIGQTYADLGNLEEAENWCAKALKADPLSLQAYYTLALVAQHAGKLDRAIDLMKKVVYIDRNFTLGHYGLANLYRDSGLLPQAQKSLDNTLKLLAEQADDQMIAGSRGVTVSRLREAVIRQQQAWSISAG